MQLNMSWNMFIRKDKNVNEFKRKLAKKMGNISFVGRARYY